MFHSKRFQFFESELITDPDSEDKSVPHPLFKIAITSCTSGRGCLMFGDDQGFVTLVERDFRKPRAFQAYQRTVQLIQQMKQRPILVSLGSDDEQVCNIVKLWDMDKEERSGDPICLKNIILNPKSPVRIPATTFAVREDLSEMAIGFCDGSVVLISDLIRNPKQKVIRKPDETPVTVLGWKEAGKNSALFVVTSNSVSVFPTSTFIEEELHNHGCELGCGLLNDDSDLLLGRPEAIYFYSHPEGRGPCLAFDGEKKMIAWFRNNLIVVGNQTSRNTVNIYDMKNKFTAFTNTYVNITHVLSEWGIIFILTKDGKAYQLKETDTQSKLEILYNKHYYQLAINLASTQQYDYNSIVDIYRKYGDHLYGKGDYDGAINQYLKTIGGLEPSYVIRKFLDAQRIHNLTSYLQALHEQNRANADHTTLLLNCYTKLKDESKLNEFIKPDSGYRFDVETAIKVCRQAQYFGHALSLARTHNKHEWYLKILLGDTMDFPKALDYIATLDFHEAEKNMKLYGKAMMDKLPERTTEFLFQLCTFYVPTKSDFGLGSGENTVLPNSILADINEMLAAESASEIRAKPEEFIHIFINKEDWLVNFLERIVNRSDTIPNLHPAIYDTLLELYIQNDDVAVLEPNERQKVIEERHEKAKQLLMNEKAVFDDQHALALCKQYNFKPGILYLYKKQQMFNEIIEYHMAKNEYDELIRACNKYGKTDPNLWVQTLSYFANKEGEQCLPELGMVLQNIDKDNLLPPLLVLQILSQKKTASLELIKPFLLKRLKDDQNQIAEVQKLIRDNTKNTTDMKLEIENLKTKARIFQLNKCSQCSQPLDLPAVHFLCMHSYHVRCMADDNECWLCADDNKQVIEINRSLEANIGQHDQFFKQLKQSSDGFATAAEYFGRGIFNKVRNPQAQNE